MRSFAAIAAINRTDKTAILLIEQNARQALKLADRGYVMVNGRITLAGAGAELLADAGVRAAYLDGGVGKVAAL